MNNSLLLTEAKINGYKAQMLTDNIQSYGGWILSAECYFRGSLVGTFTALFSVHIAFIMAHWTKKKKKLLNPTFYFSFFS